MIFASALSGADRFDTAFDEVVDDLEAQLEGTAPSLVTLFVGSTHERDYVRLHRMLREKYPSAALVGCSAGGTIGAGRELEEGAGLSVSAAYLPDVEVRPFHLEPDRVPVPEASGLWREVLGTPSDVDPTIIVYNMCSSTLRSRYGPSGWKSQSCFNSQNVSCINRCLYSMTSRWRSRSIASNPR